MRYVLTLIIGLIFGTVAAYYVSGSETFGMEVRPVPTVKVIGFQPFWLLNQTNIDVEKKVSTLVYFGLQIADDGTIRTLANEAEQEPGYANLQTDTVATMLNQAHEAGNTISLAVQNTQEESIATMLQDPESSARNLVDSVEPFMRKHRFDDLNLDIESFIEASPEKQESFTRFVAEVAAQMKARQLGTLSIDVTPISFVRERLIDPASITPHVQTVIIMAYDYHYTGSYYAGPVAPIDGAGQTREFDIRVTVEEALRTVPASKLVLGIPTYGYEWDTVTDIPGSAAIPGTGKTLTQKQVYNLKSSCTDCIEGTDDLAKQPYLIKPEANFYRQIFYEDEESLLQKILLAREYGLNGVAIWAMGYETNQSLRILERAHQEASRP